MLSILIVDDSEVLRTQIRSLLEAADFKVVEACNGSDGLDQIKTHPEVRLILCDVNMPEMDGISMCKALHRAGNKIPILMLTTEASMDLKNAGKSAGVVAWMTKPVNEERLIGAIRKLVGSTQ